jgi:hypothetical protein
VQWQADSRAQNAFKSWEHRRLLKNKSTGKKIPEIDNAKAQIGVAVRGKRRTLLLATLILAALSFAPFLLPTAT